MYTAYEAHAHARSREGLMYAVLPLQVQAELQFPRVNP